MGPDSVLKFKMLQGFIFIITPFPTQSQSESRNTQN